MGAGISGVGAACHLTRQNPAKTYAILERRHAIGSTWDLFRYPGIRSDSDMFTFGYNFRPWTETRVLADRPSIRRYVEQTATEYRVPEHIHFGRKVVQASWSSSDARWTVEAVDEASGTVEHYTCSFLICATGYYNYDAGYVVPDGVVYRLSRGRNVLLQRGLYALAQSQPGLVRRLVLAGARRQLGADADLRHFTPRYDPWDQRLCIVPDGNLFRTIRHGQADIVTVHITTFTETGVQLESGLSRAD